MMYAAGFQIGICDDPKCHCIHIDMMDDDENIICAAAVPVEHIKGVIKNLQDAAYEIMTIKNDS
jgi:hypothetical protein